MADLLERLEALLEKVNKMGDDFEKETDLWKKEREERDRLGITNEEEAYKHYLAFMKAHGYDYEAKNKAKEGNKTNK